MSFLSTTANAQGLCPPPARPHTVRRAYVQQGPLDGPRLPPVVIDLSTPTITRFGSPNEDSRQGDTPGRDTIENATVGSSLSGTDGELRVTIPVAFLNRLIARTDTNAGPVTDFILGANVKGDQSTQSRVTVALAPSATTARIVLTLTGTTNNQTVGYTPQAAIRSRGLHDFRLLKQVDFDGLAFTTRSPSAWVTPRLRNEGAVTSLSGLPLIGPLANQIALTEADRRRPAAEQIVTQRVTEQVAPRFNNEVDQQLATANRQLRTALPRLLSIAGLDASQQSVSSTSGRILYALNIGNHSHRGRTNRRFPVMPPSRSSKPTPAVTPSTYKTDRQTDRRQPVDDSGWTPIRQISRRITEESRTLLPPPDVVEGQAFTIAVHEEFVNHLLRRASLGGTEISDRGIDRLLSFLVDTLAGKPTDRQSILSVGNEPPEFSTILLDGDEPLKVRFENGQFVLSANAGFRPLLTPTVPTQRVDIPFTLTTDAGFTLTPGEVTVTLLPGSDPNPMADLARPIIRGQVEQRLQTISLPTTLPLTIPGLPLTTLRIRNMTLANGWLLIAVD